jgi:putative Holliday junction resolvase
VKVFLSVDYGRKRWGLAWCDELRVVFTIPAATQPSFNERLAYLKGEILERKVTHLIVGLPLTLEGNKSELTLEVERFIKDTLAPLGLPVTTVDEGLSSFEAESQIPKQKIKKGLQKRDGTVDSKAAALILEDYLTQNP